MVSESTSTSAVVTSLVLGFILFGSFMGIFILGRLKFTRIYSPKSHYDVVPESKRPPRLPKDPFRWIFTILFRNQTQVLEYVGLDGYFFLRFLAIFCCVFLGGVFFYVILLPVNTVGGYGNSGFDYLSISNVKHPKRYYAHVLVGWVYYGIVLFVIQRELFFYNSLRCAALSAPKYARSISSRTVLYQCVPDSFLDGKQFFKLFNGVRRIYIARTWRKLSSKVRSRSGLVNRLEVAENKLLKKAVKAKLKADKKSIEISPADDIYAYVPEKKRPRHKKGGFFSEKIDTIDYCLEKIPDLDNEIKAFQKKYKTAKPKNSVFVEFENQYYAQIAYQTTIHHNPLRASPKFTGLAPADIIWGNLRIFWWEKYVRASIAYLAIVAITIFWAVPVAFVGSISNLTYLTNIKAFHWLRFVFNMPKQLLGIITALLPTLMLQILTYYLPIIIRGLGKVAGCPSVQQIELFTQRAYFGFLFVNSFMVVAVASSATSTVTRIVNSPLEALDILANGLPKSSNFFISYLILQGLAITGGQLAQIVTLFLYFILGNLLDKTARKKWLRFSGLGTVAWGTTFPIYSNLICITLAYSIISPLILVFALPAFFFVFVAWSYNLSYCFLESPDNRGKHYPVALFQIFAGLYVGQVCMLGIFAVGKGWGPIVLQVIALIVTINIHIHLNMAYLHLLEVIPIDCMKAADGVSHTPSFNRESEYQRKVLDKYPRRRNKTLEEGTLPNTETSLAAADAFGNGQTLLMADKGHKDTKYNNALVRFLRPDVHANYTTVKKMLPASYYDEPEDHADDKHAYDDPIIHTQMSSIWIPKDPMGLSTKEIEKMLTVIGCEDTNTEFNKKGKLRVTGPPSLS